MVVILSDPHARVEILGGRVNPIHLTKGDVKDVLRVRGKNADGSALSAVVGTVAFRMVRRSDGHVVSGSGTVGGTASDEFSYVTVSGDTDKPGTYDARFIVTYTAGGQVRSFPGAGEPDGLVVIVSDILPP